MKTLGEEQAREAIDKLQWLAKRVFELTYEMLRDLGYDNERAFEMAKTLAMRYIEVV